MLLDRQVTLPSDISLKFGRYIRFQSIPKESFPIHYFNFVPHSRVEERVPDREKKKFRMSTYYTGCIKEVTDPITTTNAYGQQKTRRKIDIQDLSNDDIEFTWWDDTTINFDIEAVDGMYKPVIIAVTSCPVSKHAGTNNNNNCGSHIYKCLNILFETGKQRKRATDTALSNYCNKIPQNSRTLRD